VEVGNKLNESTHFELPIIYDRRSPNGYAFGKPGEYVVTVKLFHTIMRDNVRTWTEIPPTKITVRAPDGKAAEAFRLIEDRKFAMALQALQTTDKAIVANAVKVAEQYPDTPYAPMCRYLAGTFRLDTDEGRRAGAGHFKEFVRRYPGHPLASAGIFNIVYAYHLLKDYDLAREWIYYLLDTDPGYRLMRVENPIAAYHFYGRLDEAEKRHWWLYDKPWVLQDSPAPQDGAR
jgi:hypothetical protein